jgi:hypothetical protein
MIATSWFTHHRDLIAIVELQVRDEAGLLGVNTRGIGLEDGGDRVHLGVRS